ncbi:outer membrane beta-barrel protein [Niastella populi]|uniref:Outer membrane protein beta-barrel domain-containing protein n=1 Tax=Niastella populi TaxID=550983 RepID=A0A1V9GDY3_9BACT|nr:outer membrane beta-barrel protein [Niastella populi]OQP68636.1 hypothetical protein A4R26_02235 [Niastella populi]
MQNLNNDMDELFRKAAAGYPLKADNSDWNGLASRLSAPPVPPAPLKKKNRFKKYGLPLLLMLLLPVFGGPPLKQMRGHLTAPPSSVRDASNTGKGAFLLTSNTPTTQFQQQPQGRPAVTGMVTGKRELNNVPAHSPVTDQPANEHSTRGYNHLNRTITSNYRQTTDAAATHITSAGTSFPLNKTITKTPGGTEKKTDTTRKSSRFYWGVVFGPEINSIENQKLQKPGFDIGIVAGITILKDRAAIETGLLYTQKYYFTDGKYFNMDKAGSSMPQGMEIMSLEGSCRLIELPVKFKYKVLQKNRSAVFLSTGISSYLMTKEENDYITMMNGTEQNMLGSYNDNCRYIAVMANIGAEYNYKIGKHTLIRIEPYIQIPLKGIGIGSMPVTTTGLHVGFIRSTPR